ncbi:MAG: Hsp20/alpha crystallin family protein [Magnetococcales bacterium]|nr:Hsp20/alpha crystallin family protein [Magnetococcales bacterium]
MAMVSYDPFHTINTLHREINRLFDRGMVEDGMMSQWPLRVDIREDNDRITIHADIPGMEQKDIQVNVENGRLTISGERQFKDEAKRDHYHRIERAYGQFSRTFQLPNTTSPDQIQASYRNGVLEIVLPKREEMKPRAITVNVE